jgi:Tol biopolymer transport system component
VDARKVLDRDAFGSLAVFEVQSFRPQDEQELILTAYAYQGGEVLGLDLASGALRNYSNSSAYEEAEGVDATGNAVYVERDLAYEGIEPGALDIWRLALDDGSWERVTFFNRYAPYYASNPAVSPDGRRLAFQLSIDGETEGQGDGILVLDLGRE